MNNCVFCGIVKGELPAYKIWEDKKHLAFLGIFPNTAGMSVVIPKKHLSSNVFSLEKQAYLELLKATREVSQLLSKKLKVERIAMISEGTEVAHAHLKLYPLWGYFQNKPQKYCGYQPRFYDQYQGWLTSQEGPQAKAKELKKIWEKIVN